MRTYNQNKTNFCSVLIRSILLIMLFNFHTSAQQESYSEEQVKSVFLFKFAELIGWPDEGKIHEFIIGVHEDNMMLYNQLSNLAASSTIKGKKVKAVIINSPQNLKKANILYLGESNCGNNKAYYDVIKRKGILMVTDNCEFIDATMMNFFLYKNRRMNFEVNSANLESSGFKISRDLLLLGGNQFDVKALFDKTEKELRDAQVELSQNRKELNKLQELINTQKSEIASQKQVIEVQDNEINKQKKQLNDLSAEISTKQTQLDQQINTLKSVEQEIANSKSVINEQNKQINDQSEILEKQVADIESKKREVESQRSRLQRQTETIDFQKTIIALIIIFISIISVAMIFIYRGNRTIKQKNKELIEKNSKIEEQRNELQNQKLQLEVSNKELESFSYSVSHDLRAPLRALDGFSSILYEDYQSLLNEEGKSIIGRIRAASNKMASLIDDMLKLSRISRQVLNMEEVNLSELSRETLDELGHHFKLPENIKVHPDMYITADINLIKIAMLNLIGNSIKFTSNIKNPEIEIGSKIENGRRTFFVKDNGVGFNMQFYDKLFNAFQRLHDDQEFPGTGIGLSIVKRIINKHGGSIWAESEVGKGAAFYFSFDNGSEQV